MCIRDRRAVDPSLTEALARRCAHQAQAVRQHIVELHVGCCLLYTSDAADERSSVDLGGRRIIKKKKKQRSVTGYHPFSIS